MSKYIERFHNNPIIEPSMVGLEGEAGTNINGPSLIKVPEWIDDPLGKYYLYFAHHKGKFIRLAYSDNLKGDWKIYKSGTLKLKQTIAQGHVASPDVHIDRENQQILMYFHGNGDSEGKFSEHNQLTLAAVSKDGLNFEADSKVIAPFYFKRFSHNNKYYAVAKNKNQGGLLLKSEHKRETFSEIKPFIERMRHAALLKKENTLYVFYSRMGDKPERILLSRVDLDKDCQNWEPSQPEEILRPEKEYEGANYPAHRSAPGPINEEVNQLRDPGIFREKGKVFLLYAAAGEKGIAMGEIKECLFQESE